MKTKKIYVTPHVQVFELAAKSTVLTGSDGTNGSGSYQDYGSSGMDEDENAAKGESFWGKGW